MAPPSASLEPALPHAAAHPRVEWWLWCRQPAQARRLACWPLLPLWCRQTSQAVKKVTSPQATLSRKAAHCTTMGGNHHTPHRP